MKAQIVGWQQVVSFCRCSRYQHALKALTMTNPEPMETQLADALLRAVAHSFAFIHSKSMLDRLCSNAAYLLTIDGVLRCCEESAEEGAVSAKAWPTVTSSHCSLNTQQDTLPSAWALQLVTGFAFMSYQSVTIQNTHHATCSTQYNVFNRTDQWHAALIVK